jgi:hypothetical protein
MINNGTFWPDVRQTFQTDDGANIQVFETGATQPDGSIHVRMSYETGSQKYYWLNFVVAIGTIRAVSANEIRIDAWQVSFNLPP